MTSEAGLPVEEHVRLLMKHLGIEQAHFAASVVDDYRCILSVVHRGNSWVG